MVFSPVQSIYCIFSTASYQYWRSSIRRVKECKIDKHRQIISSRPASSPTHALVNCRAGFRAEPAIEFDGRRMGHHFAAPPSRKADVVAARAGELKML